MVNNMALSVGNLYGLGYRVGQSIKVRFESVPELIAVINAPPTHFDIVDGKEVVVNPMAFNGYGSSTRLSNAEGVTSSLEISRDLVHVASVATGVRTTFTPKNLACTTKNTCCCWPGEHTGQGGGRSGQCWR